MNYYSMTLPELAKELHHRNIGDVSLYNELNKFYGVTALPPQQESARHEAIKRLQESEKNRPSLKNTVSFSVGIIGFLAAVATIVELFVTK